MEKIYGNLSEIWAVSLDKFKVRAILKNVERKEQYMHYLLKFSKCYCSEFNVEGFTVIETFQDLDEIASTIRNYEEPIEIYFGMNHSFEFENGEDIWNYIEVMRITDAAAKTIENLFDCSYGLLTPIDIFNDIIDKMIENAEENEEEN